MNNGWLIVFPGWGEGHTDPQLNKQEIQVLSKVICEHRCRGKYHTLEWIQQAEPWRAAASRQKEGAEKMPHVSSRELLDMSGVQECVGN